MGVSIQPKPKIGLEEHLICGQHRTGMDISIQPKPKMGLVVEKRQTSISKPFRICFNPAEAEEGFR